MLAYIIIIIIVIAIIIMYHRYKPVEIRRAKKKRSSIAKLDDPVKRQEYVIATEKDAEADADDLFTQAMLYLRIQDDLQDEFACAKTNEKRKKKVAKLIEEISKKVRKTMEKAIVHRSLENGDPGNVEERVIRDAVIEQRAIEIGLPEIHIPQAAVVVPVQAAPAAPLVPLAPGVPAQWTPDAQNVHDSVLGAGINNRIRQLREKDLQLYDTTTITGAILFAMKERLEGDEERKRRILITLARAKNNDFCERYSINELEALRLVFERAQHAKNDETRKNLNDALLKSMEDCVEGTAQSTVCTVGRISRYIASLDAVDPEFVGDSVKTIDACRVEILAKLGKLQTEEKVGADTVERICAEYTGKIPQHSLDAIKKECAAGVE